MASISIIAHPLSQPSENAFSFKHDWRVDSSIIRAHFSQTSARYYVNVTSHVLTQYEPMPESNRKRLIESVCCIESPHFGCRSDPQTKFMFKFYPKGSPVEHAQESYGSLYFHLVPGGTEDEVQAKLKVVLSNGHNFGPQENRTIEGICGRNPRTGEEQALGWSNEFVWLDLLVTPYGTPSNCSASVNLEIRFEVTYTKSGNQPIKRLLEDLSTLRKRPRFTDVILCCGRERREFPAHKAILSARSPVFEAMFTRFEESTESLDHRVEIEDIEPEMMQLLLDHIYTGDTSGVDLHATDLLEAADKYDIQSLINVCISSMIHNMTIENAAKIYYISELHSLEEVKTKAISFINSNPIPVMATEGWKLFIQPKVNLVEQLYVEQSKDKQQQQQQANSAGSK